MHLLFSLLIAFSPTSAFVGSTVTFEEPIDGLSVRFSSQESTASVRGRNTSGAWGEWQTLFVENEQDPFLRESNLVLFSDDVTAVEFAGDAPVELHPIRVSARPASYLIAGPDPGTPKILRRSEWGANDELLYVDTEHPTPEQDPSESTTDNGTPPPQTAVSQRVLDCEEAQRDHPAEFKTTRKVTKGENGRALRWAHTYSKKVDLFVVHHTAVAVKGDDRSGVERIRALYQYHSVNRGWGDIGYHYLIDEDGQIYEGKAGGDYVVGGHAYCNNVNTIGVSLLGNFEIEKPSQDQMKALQWLLDHLGEKYDVDVDDNATFHGETFSSPIVGHRDLLSTECPGFYVHKTLGQVRKNVENGDLDGIIRFPKKPTSSSRSSSRSSARSRTTRSSSSSSRAIFLEGITALGTKTLSGRPGGEVPFSVRYTAGSDGAMRGQIIADIERSDQRIGVWQMIGGTYEPVRGHIITPSSVTRGSSIAIQLKVKLPEARESYMLEIGGTQFTLNPSGRANPGQSASSVRSTQSSSRSVSRTSRSSRLVSRSSSPTIRIRLETKDKNLASCDDADLPALRRLYRGSVVCRIVDAKPALINTVTLEDYLMGLSEEPDTEPFEKQRAFAIAARTYAAHYMQEEYRKFPGKPYDGSDSPAIFQAYAGKAFESNNPRWLEAVADTTNEVITKDGKLIRPAYFSSDDGRTRAPEEIGWKNFPFAEIFTSKDDPWCEGMENRGHGVGMSGCGAEGQANDGKTAEEILRYYYPGTRLTQLK